VGHITVVVQHVGVKSPYTEISDLFMPICHSNLWKQTAQWWVCGCVGGVFAETERGAKYSAF
jgi:hypothetical protein